MKTIDERLKQNLKQLEPTRPGTLRLKKKPVSKEKLDKLAKKFSNDKR